MPDETLGTLLQECVDDPPRIWPEGKPVIPDHAELRHHDNPLTQPFNALGCKHSAEVLLGKLGSRLRTLRF